MVTLMGDIVVELGRNRAEAAEPKNRTACKNNKMNEVDKGKDKGGIVMERGLF